MKLLAASLLANAALLGAFALRPALAPPAVRDFFARQFHAAPPAPVAARPAPPKPTAAARPLWTQLGSDDPAPLVARLRAAGFPAALIRYVVEREINARFTARLRALSDPDPNLPFWKPLPATLGVDSKRTEESMQLQRERTRLLRDLFKDDFFAATDVSVAQRLKFGDLPAAKIDQLQRIEDDYAEMLSAVRAGLGGITLPEDREKLALLNREKRADLAAVLSPAEFADYEMRSSQITSSLRGRLGGFEPTEAEFRAIFQAHQALGEKFPSSSALISSPGLMATSQQDLDKQIRAVLGEARYVDYARETSGDFQQLSRLVQRDNLPASTALQAYSLREAVATESNRIFDDPALDPNQKRAALQVLAQNTRAQLLGTLGPISGPAYVKQSDSWLTGVERGAAVKFTAPTPVIIVTGDGSSIGFTSGPGTTFRSLPNPNAPPGR